VFTGWFFDSKDSNVKYGRLVKKAYLYTKPIVAYPDYHDFGQKEVLGQTIPANLDQKEDIAHLIDILYSNPNIAPFISKQLIQRLTTSNPSPEYVARVASVFNDNGEGVKGDLKAVVKAILLDPENLKPDHNGNKNFGKVNELVVSFANILSQLNAKAPNKWKYVKPSGGTTEINDAKNQMFWIDTLAIFDQGALQAPDVFNFYSNDYTPNDTYFKDNSLVAPELEIQSPNSLIKYSNELYTKLKFDKYACLTLHLSNRCKDATTMDRPNLKSISNDLFYVDLTEFYNAFEEALDGDKNGDFANIKDDAKLENALKTLVDYIDNKLTGGIVPQEYKDKLIAFLKTQQGDNKWKAEKMVSKAILSIATSPYYISIQ
jgi:hypothetical protein